MAASLIAVLLGALYTCSTAAPSPTGVVVDLPQQVSTAGQNYCPVENVKMPTTYDSGKCCKDTDGFYKITFQSTNDDKYDATMRYGPNCDGQLNHFLFAGQDGNQHTYTDAFDDRPGWDLSIKFSCHNWIESCSLLINAAVLGGLSVQAHEITVPAGETLKL